MTGTSTYVSQIVASLSALLGRHVSDETGLDGQFDFEMQWTPDSSPRPEEAASASDASGPSVFTALTEQLGLRLEARKGPVPVFVIEKIERPSEN